MATTAKSQAKTVLVTCKAAFTDTKTGITHTPSTTQFSMDAPLAEKRAKAGLVNLVETK